MIEQIRTPCIVVLIASLLTGCATVPQQGANNPEPDNPERQIVMEALVAGVAVGAGLGAAAGYAVSGKRKRTQGALLGGLAGALIGAVTARLIAEQQIKSLHDYQLDNKRLDSLLQKAQQRNQEVAQYNRQLERDISGLKKQNKATRGQIASTKLKEAQQKRAGIQRMIADRQDLAKKLVAPQRAQLEQTLSNLSREESKIDHSIKQLSNMESAVVGGAKITGALPLSTEGAVALVVAVR